MLKQEKINVPIIGLIENMAYFSPAELPDNKYYIFGKGHTEKFASKLNIPFLGSIPLVQAIAESGDQGSPIALDENSIIGKAYRELAANIIAQNS